MGEELTNKEKQFFHSNVEGYWDKIPEPFPANDLFPLDTLFPEEGE